MEHRPGRRDDRSGIDDGCLAIDDEGMGLCLGVRPEQCHIRTISQAGQRSLPHTDDEFALGNDDLDRRHSWPPIGRHRNQERGAHACFDDTGKFIGLHWNRHGETVRIYGVEMRFSFWIPATMSWPETLEAGLVAERLGYSGLWFADHFMPNQAEAADGATHEAFTYLAALAAGVPRVRLGTLVASTTYRHPTMLAKIACAIDQISDGRFVLGLGAGWQVNEHESYGLEFNTFSWRFDRLAEALTIIRGMLTERRTTFAGSHFTVTDAPCDPKPVQERLPILIGGGGEKRTLRLVAEHADEWNVWGEPEVLAAKGAVLDQHCETIGRDPASVRRTAVALLMLCDTEADAAALRQREWPRAVVIGTAEQLVETMHEYEAAGVGEFIVPGFSFSSVAQRDEKLAAFSEGVLARF